MLEAFQKKLFDGKSNGSKIELEIEFGKINKLIQN